MSHKSQIVQLYLWGYQFTEIEQRTAHSEGAIRRYLKDFRQIAALFARRVFESRDTGGHRPLRSPQTGRG